MTNGRLFCLAAALASVALSPFALHGQVGGDGEIEITLTEGTMFAAVASPDRRSIAIDLVGALWVLPIGGGEAKRITPDAIEARRPTWSPDSRALAFQGYDDGWHIYEIGVEGSGLRALTNGPFDDQEPDWSRDGRRIAFSSDRFGGIASIWQVEVETRSIRQLSAFIGNDPCWSPSDREVVFWGSPPGQNADATGVWVASPDGPEQFLGSRTGDGRYFSREGGLPSAAIPCGSGRGFALDVDGRADAKEDVFEFPPQWITPSALLYTADGHIKRRGGRSGPSTVIPFRATLKLHRSPYQRTHRDLRPEMPQPAHGIVHPAVSPDGTRIASTTLGDLWVMVIGQQPVQVTNDAFVELDPAWSPDGTRVAFASDRGGSMDLWIHDFRSKADTQLTAEKDKGPVSAPAWSPDGLQIAYLINRRTLHVVDVGGDAGRAGKMLIGASNPLGRPTWPPDSKRIAVGDLLPYALHEREGTNQLMLYAFGASPSTSMLLLHHSAGNRINNGPVWASDGARMAYVSEGKLWVIGVGTNAGALGDPRAITDDFPDSPTWQADAQHIVYLTAEGLRRISTEDGRVEAIAAGIGWQPVLPDLTVVHAGAVFDGTTLDLRRNIDIVMDKGRILAVEPHQDALHAAGRIIDASNETVMPGLIDMHAHLGDGYGEGLGRLLLAYGITSVRDPSADAFAGLEQRESYDAGRRIGPRVFLAGDPLTGARLLEAGASPVTSEGQLQNELERGSGLGYDFFSTYLRLPDTYLRRAVEYAHVQGVAVASRGLFPAVALGVDQVDGLREFSRRSRGPGFYGASSRVSNCGVSYRDVIDVITKSATTLTPLIGADGLGPAQAFALKAARDASLLDDPRLALMPAVQLDGFLKGAMFFRTRPTEAARLEGVVAMLRRTVAAIAAGGGRIVAGSGAPDVPHGAALHAELEQFVDAGLTPFQALQSATAGAAEALGVDDVLGSIEPGKLADLVFVGGDPVRDIKAARDVRRVISRGRYYDLATLIRR
jgi:Tol biopolymer transport system component